MSFFGTNRTAKSTAEFASPDFTQVTFGSGNGVISGLASSVTARLEQTIEDLYVVGSPTVYFSSGATTGTLAIARYAKCGNLFSDFTGSACGTASSIAISSTGGKSDCNCGGVSATFTGAKVQGISVEIVAGRTSISEGVTFRIVDLE